MAAEIVQLNPQDFTTQVYDGMDTNLISTFEVTNNLFTSSYIEYFVYDNNQNLLYTDYSFSQYTVQNSSPLNSNGIPQIIIDPEAILISNGFDQGEYITYFNFFNKEIGSELQQLYISEISSDRTEIRLNSTSLTGADIIEQTNNLISQRENSQYFLDFYLNFGDNILSIANNIQLDTQDPNAPTILVKLYNALPEGYDLNSQLWVVTSIEEPTAYKVTFEDQVFIISDSTPLKGPNFNLNVKDQVNNSTVSLDYASLTSTSLSSSFNQLSSLLEEKEIDINIDYTDFSNFVHFSSVQTRLENFYYKVSLIEQYSSSIAILNTTTNNDISASAAIYESKINDIITNFDGYDYYLYYSSGSYSYPKTTTEQPYSLASTTSTEVLTWLGSSIEGNSYYGGMLLSASQYDNLNQNNLYFSIPEYLRNDPQNDQYILFVEMVGQLYDNIWIYYKDVTEKYNADNRLENGISKDIVADAIRDFGIKLYQNNFSNEDLYTAFLGLTPDGALFPFPNITGSLPTPSGFEYIDTLISASSDYMPLDDVNKSLYKRIYHNLPYLLKAKGTLPALRTLITSYGIPDTVLKITEFGGKDKVNVNDWDYWENTFNYAYSNTGSAFITTDWELNSDWNSSNNVPSTVEFRFKIKDFNLFTSGSPQELWSTNESSTIELLYTGSGYTSGSYSGSIVDPYYQYAHLNFYPDLTNFPNSSASIYLPFLNEDWWSVMVTRTGNDFTLHSGNKIHESGENGTSLGFYLTSSINESSTAWTTSVNANYLSSSFEGYLQEIRYYNVSLNGDVFKDYIMNPSSTEGNSINSSPNQLAFRLPLGNELYTGSISIHPKVAGSWVTTSSFASNSSASFNITSTFYPNEEYFFYDQPVVGINNAISDKIRIENNTLPSGNTLSAIRALSQNTEASQSYTANTNLLEVAFSPQDEINQDIMDQIGYFNIGEYIGDPRLRSSSAESYPDLDNLRNEYFEKYTKNYDLVDFIRLMKFFDNSLFKMIKDFVPARTSLASGIVIKQHLLERNKYPQPQANINSTIAYGSGNVPLTFQNIEISGTVAPQWNNYNEGTLENTSGGTGGSFERFNSIDNISQSWIETIPTISGSVNVTHNSQEEFYDGEFQGSIITVTTQSLHSPFPLENQSFDYTPVRYSSPNYGLDISSSFAQEQFLNPLTVPLQGQMLLLRPYTYSEEIGSSFQFITGPSYVKIHKFDNNGIDNSIALGQLTQLLIQYSTPSTYYTLNVLNISEYPTYYLYEVNNLGSNTQDNYILDYHLSSSITSTKYIPTSTLYSFYPTESIDISNTYNSSSGYISYSNTPNITLYFTASLTLKNNSGTSPFNLIFRNITAGDTILSKIFNVTSTPTTYLFTGSFTPLSTQDHYLYAYIPTGTPVTMSNFQFEITQSTSPTVAENDSIIIEPYITTPNYYNSDKNPTINNINNDRLSTKYQDVDYSTNITTPVNFQFLISGSATKAAIQDSNYTTKKHILPRYEGSKSTSQYLNYWTPGDEGTYGKKPTIESLKTAVAYCDDISGWSPERMNASSLRIKYLIKSNGTVIIPNSTPNSLFDNKGTFETGENVEIQYQNAGSQQTQLRKIIRGGTRIEPILYNQMGSYPGTWASSIDLNDKNVPGGVISNFQFQAKPTNTYYIPSAYTWYPALFTEIVSEGAAASYISSPYKLQISSDIVSEGSTIIISADLEFANSGDTNSGELLVMAQIKNYSTGITYNAQSITTPTRYKNYPMHIEYQIDPAGLFIGEEWGVEIRSQFPSATLSPYSTFSVTQLPVPNSTVTTTGLWVSGSGLPVNNVLYTTNNDLISYFSSNNLYQTDIANSGFNPIQLPWSLKSGDEFRFEGREDRTYMVKDAYVSSSKIIVELDKPLLSTSQLNVNHFLIRRYIDDATTTIIEGTKPTNSVGPYIVKPQYVSPELDKNIDQFILDLTQKGLL